MTHTLYTGVTQSGKTTLARAFARELSKSGMVLVYDPLGTETAGGAWGNSTVFENAEQFLDTIYDANFHNAHIFIDEAHHIFSHADKSHLWLLTQGRHYGLTIHAITQRPTKIHPDARSNCGLAYMFRLANDDARLLGNDFGFSDIHKINLDRGDFLCLESGVAKFKRGNVFDLLTPKES
jgi:DNA helicase HerA-like ATPase